MAVTLDQKTDTYQENGYVRYSTSQEDHTEAGLRFFWINSDKDKTQDTTARDRGTILHGYFSNILRGIDVKVQEEWAKAPVERFQEFATEKCSAYYTEIPLVSKSLGLGCSIDYVGATKRADATKDMIMDWKSGKNLYPSHEIQLAMYMAILYDYTGVLIEDLAVVQVPQDGGKIKVKLVEDPWWKLYAGLLTFERWKIDHTNALMWVRAPQQLLDVRAKLKGKKRKDFDSAEWREWFACPWLKTDSLLWWKQTFEQQKGESNELGTTEPSKETKGIVELHQSQGR